MAPLLAIVLWHTNYIYTLTHCHNNVKHAILYVYAYDEYNLFLFSVHFFFRTIFHIYATLYVCSHTVFVLLIKIHEIMFIRKFDLICLFDDNYYWTSNKICVTVDCFVACCASSGNEAVFQTCFFLSCLASCISNSLYLAFVHNLLYFKLLLCDVYRATHVHIRACTRRD